MPDLAPLPLVQPVPAPVPRYRFGSTSIVRIDGIDLVPVGDDEHGHVMRRVDDPHVVEGLTHEQVQGYVDGGLVDEDKNGLSQAGTALAMVEPIKRLGDLGPKDLRTVLFREHMCRGFLRMEDRGGTTRSDASMTVAIREIYAEFVSDEIARQTVDGRCGTSVTLLNKPSPTALRRWLRRYEHFAFNALALRPGYAASGNTVPRLSSEERTILQRFARRYASLRRPTKASLLLEMAAVVDRINRRRKGQGLEAIRCPGKTALSNAIAALDAFAVYAGREGVDAARRKFVIVKGGLDVLAPLERVEMDENMIPLQSLLEDLGVWKTLAAPSKEEIKRRRLWISTAIDTRTRCFLALRLINNPSAASAIATLEMAVSDKTEIAAAAGCRSPWDMHGGIDTVAVDAGSGFISNAFVGCVADLGAELLRPPVKTPWLRGRKERSYRSIHTGLVAMLDGRTFENVVVKGDYEAETNAALDTAELGRLIVRWIVDVYHNRPHAGLGGQTPRNAWLELRKRFGVRLPPTPAERRHIFGTLLDRCITNSGVRFMGLHYQSPELQKLRGGKIRKDVLIRVDPLDLGSISVRTPVGRLTVPCRRAGMDGITLDHWMMAAVSLRQRFKSEAAAVDPIVLQAIRDIRAAADGARRRAGVASPILDWTGYARIEKTLFTGFERTEADIDDALLGILTDDLGASAAQGRVQANDDTGSDADPNLLDDRGSNDGSAPGHTPEWTDSDDWLED